MFLYYQNSFLATVVSILGCLMVFMGLTDAIHEKFLFIGLGIVLVICGKLISNRKAFKKWWQKIEDANLVEKIQTDVEIAKIVYSKNPTRATLKKIEALNPAAAEAIREEEDYE